MILIFDEKYIALGFIQGDGNLGRLDSTYHKGMEVNIGKNDDDVLSIFGLKKINGERKYYINGFNQLCSTLGFSSLQLPERRLPSTFDDWTDNQKISFIRGLYSANGSFIKVGRIAFKSTCKELILEIKEYLESIGFNPYYTTNKPKKIKFSNGEYLCKESYDLNLGRQLEILKFYNEIGFVHKYKMDNIKYFLKEKNLIGD